jgi:hypothetical protein
MDALATAFIAIGLLLILLLIVYLVDRVNTIEKETRRMALSMNPGSSGESKSAKAPFAGLSGRRLWEAMIGKGVDNLSDDVLAELRERYDLVLHKHLEAIYKDGWRDGERGTPTEPANFRQISTATGQVESWLPMPQVKTIHQCGLEASQRPPELWDSLRADMDEAANILYTKAQLEVRQALSGWLMPAPAANAALLQAPPADGAGLPGQAAS